MHHALSIHQITNYIKQNLTADLSLETLAAYIHFSPYHFHRQFLALTQEPPMEYIRRHRLKSASKELLSRDLNIIEIAAKYRFESQDGFCRAFKKYYGITPGKYRKLNHSIQAKEAKPIQEVRVNMYEINLYERLSCTSDDKKSVLGTLEKVLELSEKAKRFGLLSLESEIDTIQPNIFKKAIQLLIDGIEPEYCKEILLNYIICGGYRGKEFLERILIIEGMLAIQQGIPTVILKEKLFSFFGEDFINEIHKYFGLDDESQRSKVEVFINAHREKQALSKETSLIDEPFNRMDSRSLQRLLREIDSSTLAAAVIGASGKTQAIVLENLSKRQAARLVEGMTAIGSSDVSEIIECQKQILKTLHVLRSQGDVLI